MSDANEGSSELAPTAAEERSEAHEGFLAVGDHEQANGIFSI